ncbi:MAG: amidohydrolase, partial [Chloroflexi bacterium CFX2]|nr:amidohydrolase [Chloroflexi bacterium CFX2]
PVAKMLADGLNVGIGTDGPASNNDLDMFEEVRLASFVAKAASNDPTVLPAAATLTMATRLGAQALHLGEITGSLEIGKRADMIVVDTGPLHNTPRFKRDPQNAYAQLVYAAKSTDVTDVMVNGKWLMRDRQLLTINEKELIAQARELAVKIDAFLTEREQSVLSKLIALGGSMEEESFEVQVKVKVEEPSLIVQNLMREEIEITAHKHYRQFDEYFIFDDPNQGRLRFREDNLINEKGEIVNTRSRLTLLGVKREDEIGHDVLLSRSRFLAPAMQSLRFYREYFKPKTEISVEKDRLRWHIKYKNTEFFINLDEVKQPAMGTFLEVKSRTWSRKDADLKAELVNELLDILGAGKAETVTQDYIEILTA